MHAAPTLYVCHGDEGGPRVHPCRRVQEALRAAGIEYEKVIAAHGSPIPFLRKGSREKLREAGFAPPAPRSAGTPTLVQLQSQAFRCPYCGSSDTTLENIFGPTPCRSLRYCESCRQPFEQFKTI